MQSTENTQKVRLTEENHERTLQEYPGWNKMLAKAAFDMGCEVDVFMKMEAIRIQKGEQIEFFECMHTPLNTDVGARLANNKYKTSVLLGEAGVPTPKGHYITASSFDAENFSDNVIPLPCVVKPAGGTHGGSDVHLNIQTVEECKKIVEKLLQSHTRVLIEEYVSGLIDYRLLVLDGELLAATERVPAYVTGDGQSTIVECIDAKNAKRKDIQFGVIGLIKKDESVAKMLERQGHTYETILEHGQVVQLQDIPNASLGGEFNDVTDIVDKDIITAAVKAVSALGLRYAGVDIVAEDIAKPFHEQRGYVIEVNEYPGISSHLYPTTGKPRNVHESIIRAVFNISE